MNSKEPKGKWPEEDPRPRHKSVKKTDPQKPTVVSETRTCWLLQPLSGEPLMLGIKHEADFSWHYGQICKGEWLTRICEISSLGENMEKICPWQDVPLKALRVTWKKLKSLLSVQTTAWSLWEQQSGSHSCGKVEENSAKINSHLGVLKSLLKNSAVRSALWERKWASLWRGEELLRAIKNLKPPTPSSLWAWKLFCQSVFLLLARNVTWTQLSIYILFKIPDFMG